MHPMPPLLLLFIRIAVAHVVATCLVLFVSASWYIGRYEHGIVSGSRSMAEIPMSLKLLKILGEILAMPLVAPIYSWQVTAHMPIVVAIVVNSVFVSLLIALSVLLARFLSVKLFG